MIKVLVVDDSTLMRQMISDIVESDPDMTVISTASNGEEAIEKVILYSPDVVLMDIEMPVMNGLIATRRIMEKKPVPIIIISGCSSQTGDITLKSLESGAVDFIPKPSGTISPDIEDIAEYIKAKIKIASLVDIKKISSRFRVKEEIESPSNSDYKMIVIGCSTGGPRALNKVVPYLPEDLPVGVVIVQHMPSGFTKSLAQRLDKISPLYVKEAEDGEFIEPGKVLIAQGGKHLIINKDMSVSLEDGLPYNNVKPSLDKTLFSIKDNIDDRVMLVVLTGMGKDGLEGTLFLKDKGAYVIVESPETAIVDGMPGSIRKKGLCDEIVPIYEISSTIVNRIKG